MHSSYERDYLPANKIITFSYIHLFYTVLSNGNTEEISASGRIQILDRGELLIVTAKQEDSGVYTCNASNSQGYVSASASLNVYGKCFN